MQKLGKLKRASYRNVGPQMQIDALVVEFEVDGDIYEHPFPNMGWNYHNPALMFLGYLDKRPTEIDGTSFDIEGIQVPVGWVNDEHEYLIDDGVLETGQAFLKQADWFDPEGDVYDSEGNQGFGGMNVDGGTGNQATVEIEAGGE